MPTEESWRKLVVKKNAEIASLLKNREGEQLMMRAMEKEIARLKKIEERLGSSIGLVEQIDELEAELDLSKQEIARLQSELHDALQATLPDRVKLQKLERKLASVRNWAKKYKRLINISVGGDEIPYKILLKLLGEGETR